MGLRSPTFKGTGGEGEGREGKGGRREKGESSSFEEHERKNAGQ